ncbi:hypothetical protein SAMN05216266_11694 [Amycolatopsis marina]|uniref:Uncharacterized protein n=1 Tax=Amycolatopsis marina TaxID=490629 RepID=A0A1I1BR17_9PSEU|nr:protein DpdG [Amycolatopsis marina]SFB52829.1 hypothetical protein SAMN05216266_11694 [Amycolatopsis marina]
MDYLTTHNLASVPALFVICRYLATRRRGETMEALKDALAPAAVTAREDNAAPGVLKASLEVGVDLGLLEADGRGDRRVWTLRETVASQIRASSSIDSSPFRSLVLRRLGATALAAVEAGKRPPDVALALIWLLRQDPLAPMGRTWDDGLETAFKQAGLGSTIKGAERWLAFLRWARSLGLITFIPSGTRKEHVLVDPSEAVANVLHEMPDTAAARQWFARLISMVPLLGDPRLVAELPMSQDVDDGVSDSAALAMHKLERSGRLRLIASDDAADAVVLSLGKNPRRIGQIQVLRGSA